MLCDLKEAAWLLGYKSPATLYRLLNAGLLADYVEMYEGLTLLRMESKGKSPTLAIRVRSLVNFKGTHEMFMFNPKEEESLERVRQYHSRQKAIC